AGAFFPIGRRSTRIEYGTNIAAGNSAACPSGLGADRGGASYRDGRKRDEMKRPRRSLTGILKTHIGVVPDKPISPTTLEIRPRLEGAEVGVSVCPYCAVGCSQLVYHRDGTVLSIE